jgi:hypothetical protein
MANEREWLEAAMVGGAADVEMADLSEGASEAGWTSPAELDLSFDEGDLD